MSRITHLFGSSHTKSIKPKPVHVTGFFHGRRVIKIPMCFLIFGIFGAYMNASAICVFGAVAAILTGHDGWGWLLFIALLLSKGD